MSGVKYICEVYELTLKAILQLFIWTLELRYAKTLNILAFENNNNREFIVYQDGLIFGTVPSSVEILFDQIQAYESVWVPTKH